MINFSPYEKTSESLQRLWEKLSEHRHEFPAGDGDSMEFFLDWATDPRTKIYEVGDFQGAFWFLNYTDVDPDFPEREVTAEPHILLWDKSVKNQPEAYKQILMTLMDELKITRYVTKTSIFSHRAIRFLGRLGFNEIGILRSVQGLPNGMIQDMILYDCLRSDLTNGNGG